METKVVSISPKQAQEWLSRNDINRPPKESLILYLSKQMDKGLWRLNGETIIISKSGRLLDGQHRLHAVIKSGKTIKSNVCFDVSEDTFDSIDTGRQRSGGDVLSIRGIDNSIRKSSIIRAILLYKRGNMRAFGWQLGSGVSKKVKDSTSISNHDILEYMEKNSQSIEEIYQFSVTLWQKVKIISLTQLAIFYYLFSQLDKDKAQNFLNKLILGENISHGDIIGICRRRIENNSHSVKKLPPITITAYIIKTWNAYVLGKTFSHLSFDVNKEKFPAVIRKIGE